MNPDGEISREPSSHRPDRPDPAGVLETLSLAEIVKAVRDGSLSPTELVTEAVDSLQRWQPVTNAASQLWPAEALAAARALPADPDLVLGGVPVLVKESMDVAGHPSTACCDAFRDRLATSDCALVASLKSAGAIVVGKANMHELGASGTNHISACGPTHNPWDARRLTGGSSGGSAAAVATRSVPLALGTDTAGSIRVPSSFCGVVGLKPTQGRLPMNGVLPLAVSFGCAGPLAAGVEDVALAFGVLAGEPDGPGRVGEPVSGVRVGRVESGYYAELVHPQVRGALDRVAAGLAATGVRLNRVSLPAMDDALGVWSDIAWPEFASSYPDLELQRVGRQIADHYRYGKSVTADRAQRARARALEISASFLAALHEVDVLLLPCTPYSAPRFTDDEIDVGDERTMNVFRGGPVWFGAPVNIAGLPALALPAGFDDDGLPLGVQLVGRAGEEWTLLRIGAALQALTGYDRTAPPRAPVRS